MRKREYVAPKIEVIAFKPEEKIACDSTSGIEEPCTPCHEHHHNHGHHHGFL